MSKPLVVVESPAKVRTIKKYLGDQFNVVATVGHIRDLPEKEMGIDIEDGFKPKYQTISGKKKIITMLKASAGDTDEVYLAPDPDREGEAIAWHTAEILKKKDRKFFRVLFNELTKNGIEKAMKNPQTLNPDKYEAQQARRILDRLVGYQISPLLWRKVKGSLSAGRVQSVAVRIICERENAIFNFTPVEYWSITANLRGHNPPEFSAKLAKKNNQKLEIGSQKEADAILKEISDKPFTVEKVVKRTTKRNPQPPFITSKLQQESIRKLRFSAKKTMMIAQQLYEGVELSPGDPVGLITYMRTDSIRISEEAAKEAIDYIRGAFGENYLIASPRIFKNSQKAQDAHEAIRPTSVFNTPEKMAPHLNSDQLMLYELIWKRFVASQMKEALIDQSIITIASGSYSFSASGSIIKFPGFMFLYLSADDEDEKDKKKQSLPDIKEKEDLKLLSIDPKQHFTQPPPRFSEASLVKELEENGIGRPSTYATILSTIREKGYVEFLKGNFRPSELGFIVNELLMSSFPNIMEVEFTANLENDLDRIEAADVHAVDILNRFYGPFKEHLDSAHETMLNVKGVGLPTTLICPQCHTKELRIKIGKNGHFIACSGYPECTYSRDYERDEKGLIHPLEPLEEETTDKTCDKCGKPMIKKRGRYGEFLACSGYPDCKHTLSLNSSGSGKDTGVKCPEKDCDGHILERSSKRGKLFYGCSRFPECKFATWDKVVNQACPECGNNYMVEKNTKKDGNFISCPNKECGHRSFPDNG